MYKLNQFGIFLLLAVLLYASCKNNGKNDASSTKAEALDTSLKIEAYIVRPTTLTAYIEAAGSLLPYEETEVRSEINGRVTGLYVREGSYVQKGSLLVKLFDSDLQAQLKKLQVQLKMAEKTVERQKELLKISGISEQEVDLSELQVSNLMADIQLVKVNIGRTVVKAPFSGRLGLKQISNGAYITPATLITTLRQTNQLKLGFNVPEMYSARLQSGQTVQFKLANSPKLYNAVISATEAAVEENTRNLAVRAIVTTSGKELLPGEFAKVSIAMGGNNETIQIPTQSVVPIGRKKQVFILKSGKASAVDIITGVRDSSRVEVLSGLQYGDTVLTTGLLFVKQGSEITVSKISE
jgi:membrane fusion protein (multidrug efflux system)